MDKIKDRMKEFYNNLNDRPLEPGDIYYVPRYDKQPDDDPIKNIHQKIRWSEAGSVHLLSGQRGTGKSTELRRLRKLLEDDGCIVFLCDIREYTNLTTSVDISDFFISIMGGLSDEFHERYQENPSNESYWDRVCKFLRSEIDIKEIGLEIGLGGAKSVIKASLKDDPTFRRNIQEKSRGHVAKLTFEAQRFVTDVVTDIRRREKDPHKKVVFLIDSVEQIRGIGEDADNVYRSVENLFSGHAEKLCLPLLHVLYTIPPYLTPLMPGLGRQLGGSPTYFLPSVHVRKKIADGTCVDDPKGLEIMHEIIQKRYEDWKSIFPVNTLDKIARMSGGDLRDFFRMVQECLIKATIKNESIITDEIIRDTENQFRRDMLPIAREDLEWLKLISCTKKPNLDAVSQLPRLARFFETHVVLNYRNGGDWYDIHPLLESELESLDD